MNFVKTLLLFLLLSVPLATASENSDNVKAALIFKIIDYIEWPNESLNDETFTVAIVEADGVYQSLRQVDGRTVKNRTIKIIRSNSSAILRSSQVVFVGKSAEQKVYNLSRELKNSSTLFITDDTEQLADTMINLTVVGERVGFQINRPNILAERLKIGPDLLLLGGTELDVVNIYQDMMASVDNIKQQLLESEKRFAENKKQQDEALATLNRQVASAQSEVSQAQQKIKNQSAELEKQQQLLNKKSEEVNAARAELKQLDELLKIADQQLEKSHELMAQQRADEAEVLARVEKSQLELTQLEEQLATTSEQLSASVTELDSKTQKIESQSQTLRLIVAAVVLLIAIIAIISLLVYRYKKTASKLQTTLDNLREAQSQLVESEKLASMGQLVAGVAHELNTPIGIAITCSSSVTEKVWEFREKVKTGLSKKDLERFLEYIEQNEQLSTRNLERAAHLITSFKSVSTDQMLHEEREINVTEYLQEIMDTLSVTLRRAGIEWTLEGDSVNLTLDPGILAQVVQNIVMNAVKHAFEDREKKTIDVKLVKERREIKVKFSDNGVGMPDDVQKKIFNPFFTTKRGKGGTGLGMHIVYNLVVQKLNGKVSVESSPGTGTCITLCLPI